jgi:uncharacterized membrane protein
MAKSDEVHTQSFLGMVYTFRPEDQAVHPAGRLAGFTDAILAIAATLTVLNLTALPENEPLGGALGHQIDRQWPILLSTLLGFMWITGTWVLSHRQMRQLRGADHYMTLFVIARALVITLIPWATLLLARGFSHDDFWIGVEAVALVVLVEQLFAALGTDYAHRRGLLVELSTPGAAKIALRIWAFFIVLTIIACVSAPWIPWFALAIIILTRISSLLPLGSDRKGLAGDIGTIRDELAAN